jgi:hypothetical protein
MRGVQGVFQWLTWKATEVQKWTKQAGVSSLDNQFVGPQVLKYPVPSIFLHFFSKGLTAWRMFTLKVVILPKEPGVNVHGRKPIIVVA